MESDPSLSEVVGTVSSANSLNSSNNCTLEVLSQSRLLILIYFFDIGEGIILAQSEADWQSSKL